MPNIHIPTLLFVLGAGALVVAVVGMMLNEKESKKRAAARRNRAVKSTRVLESRTPTNVGRVQDLSRTASRSGQVPQTISSTQVPRTEEPGSPPVKENPTEPLHSASPVLDEAQRLAELMAEDAPERIVAILREWMREDQ
jgi:flagellar biosynthesis/type III secretory pathway M-ring protein FliF/YscJ